MNTEPEIIERDGSGKYAVIPYEEFLVMKEQLEDYADLKVLREAKRDAGEEKSIPLDEVRSEILSD